MDPQNSFPPTPSDPPPEPPFSAVFGLAATLGYLLRLGVLCSGLCARLSYVCASISRSFSFFLSFACTSDIHEAPHHVVVVENPPASGALSSAPRPL